MASKNVVQLTDQNFEKEVLQSDVPVLVDFWATWCGPCVAIAPIVDELADEHVGKLKVAKMDIDSNPKVPSSFGVMSIPTLLVFKGGEIVGRQVGAGPKAVFQKLVKPHVA